MTELPFVIDLETSVNNVGEDAVGSFKASPYHPDNKVVLYGTMDLESERLSLRDRLASFSLIPTGRLIVGQNIKFDLLHALNSDRADGAFSRSVHGNLHEIKIWDTQLAEYILSGQEHKQWSLNQLAEQYQGTQKEDKIKAYWEEGVKTEDIPKEELEAYLKDDLLNTYKVYQAQREQAEQLNLMPLMRMQMLSLLATTEMENNGMHYNREKANLLKQEAQNNAMKLMSHLLHDMIDVGIPSPNPNSNEHISAMLFGGDVKYVEDVPVLNEDGTQYRYKTGKRKGEVKTRKETLLKTVSTGIVPEVSWRTSSTTKETYQVSVSVLEECLHREGLTEKLETFIKTLLNYRKLNKEITTYWEGLDREYWPTDGRIHGSLMHTNTATGRLSSKAPNLQNLTGKT